MIKKSSLHACMRRLNAFIKRHWKGLLVISIVTTVFFWPVIIRAGSYSEGGDAMFNAWTLARDQHCVLRQGCPNYNNSNIYFPHKDSMLYSETQLSAGVITLPLYAINHNPIFSYNIWTIISCLFSGVFMYLLAMYLSKGNRLFSVFAGLIFEFAPFKMAGLGHLQNLSIFCLPLAILLILKFFELRTKKYLWLLLMVLVYQFYASWYQMVFALIAIGVFLLMYLVLRLVTLRQVFAVSLVVVLAVISTAPLAKNYIRFSKENNASFGIVDQTMFSSSVIDYLIPHNGTVEGHFYYSLRKHARINAYNLDSYSYAGVVMYAVAAFVTITAVIKLFKQKAKKMDKEVLAFFVVGLFGLIASFGPLLKIRGNYTYNGLIRGLYLAIPMPYLIIDKLVPQLHFIRAVGRISVLFLFALCCLLAYLPFYLKRTGLNKRWQLVVQMVVVFFLIFELMPTRMLIISPYSYAYGHTVPAVYQYIKDHNEVSSLVILRSNNDYPKAPIPVVRAEDVLWAGYHNKSIFNGYSGYEPPEYGKQYADFVDFHPDDIQKLRDLGVRYVLVDKLLSPSQSGLLSAVSSALPNKVYEDGRYALYKL